MMAMTDSPLLRPASSHLFIGKTEFGPHQFCGTFEPSDSCFIDLPATRADVVISYRRNWFDKLAGIERFVVLEKATVESSEVVGDEVKCTFNGHGLTEERLRWRGWGDLEGDQGMETRMKIVAGWQMDWLQKALGLPKHVTYIGLRCRVDEIVTVECEYFPEIGEGEQLAMETEFAKYRLERIEEDPEKLEGEA